MSSLGEEASSSSAHPIPQTSQTMDPSAILIKVLSPAENFPTDLAFRVLPKSTIGELKNNISTTLDSRPANDQQRLIYRGKMLTDELVIETILGLGPGKDRGVGETPQDAYTFHLVIRPSINSPTSPNPPPNPFIGSHPFSNTPPLLSSSSPSPPGSGPTTTTTTTSTITPTSTSSIVTTTTRITTTSVLPRSNGGPSIPSIGSAPPNYAAMSIDELRQTLRQRAQATEQQQDNLATQQRFTEDFARMNEDFSQRVTTAVNPTVDASGRSTGISIPGLGASGSGSLNRTQTPRYGPGGIPLPSTGVPTPVASGSGTITSSSGGFMRAPMSEQMNQILEIEDEARRRALLELQQEEVEQHSETTSFTATNSMQNPLTAFYPPVQPVVNNLLGGNNLIYLLQDASGMPTALLVGPPGSAGSPFPVPIPAANINWAPGGLADIPADFRALGWPVPDNLNLGAHGNNIFQNGGFGFQDPQARAALNLNRNRPMNLGEILAGVRARATHFWLAVRLAVFVVLFTGSGGWRRMLYLGSIAVLIFIWQTGIFNDFFRPFLEAINPPAPRPNPNPNPAAGPNPDPNQPQTPQQPLARDTNGNPIGPANTAEMLLARREDRIRGMIRGVERGITIFLASLVPGLHERHVDAVEARQREVQQLRDAQEAANAEAADVVAVEGQEPAGDVQEGADLAPPQAPVVEAEPEVIRGLL